GEIGRLLASTPPGARGQLVAAIRSAAAAGINDLLYVTGALALAGAVCALLLIRSKDFVRTGRTAAREDDFRTSLCASLREVNKCGSPPPLLVSSRRLADH
ncbi:MAG: hypothetical protein M3Z75_28365, partial [Actinomycetota bacterium]|nr:hypothetical protein [Actinomycetota bacterium]